MRMENNSEILTKEQWKDLGSLYRPEANIPEATVKRFLNNEIVKFNADKYLIATMKELNIDIPFLMQKKKEVLENSLKDKQLNVALKTIESFENNLGLNNKVKVTESRQFTENSQLTDNYNKAKKEKTQVTITKTSENEEDQANDNG